jgi:hypothetical protein
MGIDTKDFSVYSIKHAAVSYLVRKKFTIKEIEQAMHYKQRKNTITNHYGVKESIKRVGVMLASTVHEPDTLEQDASESIVKTDSDVKKAEQKVELIKILNSGIWDASNEKEKELLIQRRAEITNDLKDIVKGKANVLRSLYYSSSTTFPLSPEFKAFKIIENIYKKQLFYVNPNLFNLEFPCELPPIKMITGNSLPKGLTLSDVINLPIVNNNSNNKSIIRTTEVFNSDGIKVATTQESILSNNVSGDIVPFQFPSLFSPPLKDKPSKDVIHKVKIEEIKDDDDDEEKKLNDKIIKAWGEHTWDLED